MSIEDDDELEGEEEIVSENENNDKEEAKVEAVVATPAAATPH